MGSTGVTCLWGFLGFIGTGIRRVYRAYRVCHVLEDVGFRVWVGRNSPMSDCVCYWKDFVTSTLHVRGCSLVSEALRLQG